ncbi:MAG: FG-GAP repeat domain-containing protein [Verrucomicrobiales bacterium]|jgi:hypothetical protein
MLFRNDGEAGYKEVAGEAGLDLGQQSWAADFGDIDNDGDLDVFVGNHKAASKLFVNNGDGHLHGPDECQWDRRGIRCHPMLVP